MFIGTATTTLVNENNLNIPESFSVDGLFDLVVTSGFEKNLLLVPQSTFISLQNSIKSLNLLDPGVRLLNRLFLGRASILQVTSTKQISIPQGLLDFAEISAKVVVVGQGAFLELWSEDNWKKQAIVLDSGDISFNDTISLTLER